MHFQFRLHIFRIQDGQIEKKICHITLFYGEFDPAYQPQQVALTAGFMCILACDCNNSQLPAESLAAFAESPDVTLALQIHVCKAVPWETVDFTEAADDVNTLADLSAPLMEVCGCSI